MNEVCANDLKSTEEYFLFLKDHVNDINKEKWDFTLSKYKCIHLKSVRKLFKQLREYLQETSDLEEICDYYIPEIKMTVGEYCVCHVLKK